MKKNLEILDFEDKATKAGKPYVRFKTMSDLGEKWMSCFNGTASSDLKKLNKKTASVELIESGDFHNITKCYGEAEGSIESLDNVEVEKPGTPVEVPGQPNHSINQAPRKSIKGSAYEKDPVGLAVEMFVSKSLGIGKYSEDMDACIDLVRQAQEAFK